MKTTLNFSVSSEVLIALPGCIFSCFVRKKSLLLLHSNYLLKKYQTVLHQILADLT